MKLLFSFVFLLFSSLSFQSQAQILIEYPINLNMDKFDWSAFIDEGNTQKHIEFRNRRLDSFGAGFTTITGLNIGKLQLMQIEQELGLYKQGIKTGLSAEMIQAAEEAIALHWENVNSIENQIKARAGLASGVVDVIPAVPMVGKAEDYYNGVWELHKGDHEVVFNMVEKKDEALYKAFGGNDEAYVGFIAPYVERYMGKMGGTAEAYHGALESAYKGEAEFKKADVTSLIEMYTNSLEIYKCFNKNFKGPVGVNQQRLMGSIESWHMNQALLGANSLIETYNVYGERANPFAIVNSFFKFYEAPASVKERIGEFLRDSILNNEEFINTRDNLKLLTRVYALIGLNYLGVATLEEQELYNKARRQGIIEYHSTHSFSGNPIPLPE